MSCDAPRSWPSSNCSRPEHRGPRRASCQAGRAAERRRGPRRRRRTSLGAHGHRRPASSPSRGSSQRRMSRLSVLHRGEPAAGVGARGHAPLDRLADRPVLPVRQVPELGGVGRVEVGGADLVGLRTAARTRPRCGRRRRPQRERGHVVGGQRQQQVGVDQLALVPRRVRRRRGRGTVRRSLVPGQRERPGALAVRDAVLPVQVRAAAARTPARAGTAPGGPGRSGSTRCSSRRAPSSWPRPGRSAPARRPARRAGSGAPARAPDRAGRPAARPCAGVRCRNTNPPHASTADRVQREAGRVEVVDAVGVRRVQQSAVEAVGPGVVRAAQRPRRARLAGAAAGGSTGTSWEPRWRQTLQRARAARRRGSVVEHDGLAGHVDDGQPARQRVPVPRGARGRPAGRRRSTRTAAPLALASEGLLARRSGAGQRRLQPGHGAHPRDRQVGAPTAAWPACGRLRTWRTTLRPGDAGDAAAAVGGRPGLVEPADRGAAVGVAGGRADVEQLRRPTARRGRCCRRPGRTRAPSRTGRSPGGAGPSR